MPLPGAAIRATRAHTTEAGADEVTVDGGSREVAGRATRHIPPCGRFSVPDS